jgi:hypothetical protein
MTTSDLKVVIDILYLLQMHLPGDKADSESRMSANKASSFFLL